MSLQETLRLLFAWRPGRLAKGTLAMTTGMGLRALAQAAVFIIVARVIGVENFGAFSAILAIAGFIGSFSGFGTQILMMRDVSRDPSAFPISWGHIVLASGVSFPIIFACYLLFIQFLLPGRLSFFVIVSVGVAELLFMPFCAAAMNAFQGHERIARASHIVLAGVIPRLLSALVLVLSASFLSVEFRLPAWAALYSLAALASSIYSWCIVGRDLGTFVWPRWLLNRRDFCDGLTFAFGGAALKLYSDIDKTMLARMASLEIAGFYSAGYRVIDVMIIPIVAILNAATPRFFRASESGQQGGIAYALAIVRLPVIYAVMAGSIVYFAARFLPWVLGPGYFQAVSTLQWLCWLPFVCAPRLSLQTAFGATGRQYAAVAIITSAALLNILLNFLLIPTWGWQGAVIATYAAEILMTIVMLALGLRTGGSNGSR